MNKKAILLISTLALGALLAAATFMYGRNSSMSQMAPQATNNQAGGKLEAGSGWQAIEALNPATTPAAVPCPFPPPAAKPGLATMPVTVNRVTEKSVLVPTQVAPGAFTQELPARVENNSIAQVPVGTAPVQYVPSYTNTRVKRVVVRKYHHSGRVHVIRAVKHIVGFSAKLPFKLSP